MSHYKYLGIYLDELLDYNKCVNVLSDSASRALSGIIAKVQNLKDCGYNTYTKLFDTGVLPILNYGSEVWGYGDFSKCDIVMNRAMRFFLGVHRFAPTAGVQGEMGWMSLKYRRYLQMIKFWNRLIQMDSSRLTKRIFVWCNMHTRHSWGADIKKIAQNLELSCIYNSRDIFNEQEVKVRLLNLMKIDWQQQVLTKPRL